MMYEDEFQEKDPIDIIKLDVPLFIRLLEYSREDIHDDVELHRMAANIIRMSKKVEHLSMNDLNEILKDVHGDELNYLKKLAGIQETASEVKPDNKDKKETTKNPKNKEEDNSTKK